MEDLFLYCVIFTLASLPWLLYTIVFLMCIVSFAYGHQILYTKCETCDLGESVPGVSVIKPLFGIDDLLQENLESHFQLQYPKLELLLCIQDVEDPAVQLVRTIQDKYPHVRSKVFLGGKNGIVNPMVHNMAPAYEACQYDLVWISSSRVKVTTDVLLNLVEKIQDPKVALVQQMPFIADHQDIPTLVEKMYFGTVVPRYYFTSQMLGLTCFTGMSYLVKKQELDLIKGLAWYGKYMAEDYFLARTLSEKGFKHKICAFPAIQNVASASITSFKDRMIRWQRLRMNMLPLTALEPCIECLPLSVFMSWSLYFFFQVWPLYSFPLQMSAWFLVDYIQLMEMQGGPLPFSVIKYMVAWFLRHLLFMVIYLQSLLNVKHIYWGTRSYRLSNYGQTVKNIQQPNNKLPL